MSENIIDAISESEPCGSDYKYEDAFIEIEQEVDKANSMSEGVSTDWTLVKSKTYELLCHSTKDLKMLSWWVYASWKVEGAGALEQALKDLNALFLAFEDKLYPKSKKVKISSLMWLEETLQAEILDARGVLKIDLNVDSTYELLKELENNFTLVVKEELSVFRKLRLSLERAKKENAPTQVVQTPRPTSSSSKPNTQGILELGEINSDADALSVFRSLKKSATLLHNYYRKKDAGDIRALKLTRLLAWLEIDTLPMNDEGKTPLNPPSSMSIDSLESLLDEENFEAAYDYVENLIMLSPFWLEGHYMAWDILTKMEKDEAALEVKNALVSFVSSNKGILELSFRDTTPFASLKLKQWLASSMSSSTESKRAQVSADPREELIEKSYTLAKKKKIKEALGLLQGSYVGAVNNEDKFYWRLKKAELAFEFGKKDVALALVEDLKSDIDKYKLDEWNPTLAAKVFNLYLSNLNRTQVDVDDINAAYARLCKIDITQALEITL